MNKALHRFYLFALNRLSEARRDTNRGSPTLKGAAAKTECNTVNLSNWFIRRSKNKLASLSEVFASVVLFTQLFVFLSMFGSTAVMAAPCDPTQVGECLATAVTATSTTITPKIYTGHSIGPFNTTTEACNALVSSGAKTLHAGATLFGTSYFTYIVSGYLPYDTAGLQGWGCNEQWTSAQGTVYKNVLETMYPVCPSSYAPGTYPLGSGNKYCPAASVTIYECQDSNFPVGPDANHMCHLPEQKGDPGTCPKPLEHNPINTANGNKLQVESDYLGSSASTLSFSRTYNSLDGQWRHNHSTHLRVTTNTVVLVMDDGREAFFTVNNATTPATVTPLPSELGHLTKVSGAWLYTAKNNDTYSFDATGRLTRWTNTSGAEHQLTYVNGSVTVSDNIGHSLSFTEDALHQPLTFSAPSLQITYSYNANKRLIQLTRTRGGQTEQRLFHYEDPRNNALLTGITDESGVRYATWSYDSQGRAISSEHAGGVEHGTVAYNADGSSTSTNALGKQTTYRFVVIDGIKRVSAIEGEASASCPMSNSTFTYDSRGLLKTKTDNKGHLTTYAYNARGLEISRTEAAGTAQARTISTTWHATFNLPLTVTEPGRVTTYTYDAQGRQLSQTSTAL